MQLYFFIFSIVRIREEDLLSLPLRGPFYVRREMQRRGRDYDERTALIILLFSNESVDADGSVPAYKMHGTGCICESPSCFVLLLLLHLRPPAPVPFRRTEKRII